ncbi:MAG: Bro-N domain-containing protein [Thermoanaerobacter sp.]|nr:Bro-N domain-containing protein [Thermoanaerobacter sp.]
MNTLPQVFSYREKQVRVIVKDGEPWFIAKDVCEILDIANSRDAIARLDGDEKGVAITDTPGGPQEMQIVNEPGLYSLIFTSRKPEAKAFKRWVTHEVLPTIRKTGKYDLQNKNNPLRQAEIEARLRNSKTRQAKLMKQMAEDFKDQLSPEAVQLLIAGATELLMGRPLLPKPQIDVHFTITEIAEELGCTANRLGRIATKYNLRVPENGKWVLDKAVGHNKQVRNFLYNVRGRQALIEAYHNESKVVSLVAAKTEESTDIVNGADGK